MTRKVLFSFLSTQAGLFSKYTDIFRLSGAIHLSAETIDSYDKAILNQLSTNGRITITELSRIIGLSKTPCQARIKRLESDGYITGYRALLNPIKLGLDHVAFVEVKLTSTNERALKAFNAEVTQIKEIEQCHMIAGGFDYLLKVRTQSIAEYRRVMGERISSLPHVASTSTFVAMEAVKEGVL